MATYCDDKKGATVVIGSGASRKRVRVEKMPVTVTCKNNTQQQCRRYSISGTSSYVNRSNGVPGVQTVGGIFFGPIRGIRANGSSVELLCNGNPAIDACVPSSIPRWVLVYGNSGLNFTSATLISVTDVSLPQQNPAPESKGLLITDAENRVVYDSNNDPCNWIVTCDEDCPEGTCRCESPVYPGYCCNDCAATAASIRTITNELRVKNG